MIRDDSPKRVGRTGFIVVVVLLVATLLLTRCGEPPQLLAAPPDPTILSGPPRATNRAEATFTYTNEWQDVAYRCVLDRVRLRKCPIEGISYGRLGRGQHVFNIAAKKGRLLSDRVKYTWVVVGPSETSDDGSSTPTTSRPPTSTPVTSTDSQAPAGPDVVGSFTISGDIAGLLSPGTQLPVNVAFSNPWSFPILVGSLTISVHDETKRNGVPNPGCVGSQNLLVIRTLGTVARIPAHRTRSLEQLGIPQSQWPVVLMPNLSTNQDACKETHFSLHYSGTATR